MDAIFKPSSFVPLITISWIRAADTPRVRRSILWTSRCAVSGRAAACRWSACRWSTSIRWRRAAAFFKPVSWKINTGLARTRLASGSRVGVYRTNGGAGRAFGSWDRAVVYAFAEATLDVGDELTRYYALGLGPSVGVFLHPHEAWKLNLFARVQDFRSGDDYTAYDIALEQSLSLGRQQALRLAFGTQRERGREWGSGTLSW